MSVGKDMKNSEAPYIAGRNIKWYVWPLWKTVLEVPQEVKAQSYYMTQQFHKRIETYVHTKTYTQMSVAALFTLDKK